MRGLLDLGRMLAGHARLTPDRLGARDLDRKLTFGQWNARARRLANALLGLGLARGDRVAVLAYNCLEWAEIYAATAKAGLVAVPINFRLVGREIRFIVENAEASALIVQGDLVAAVEEVRSDLPIRRDRFVHFGAAPCPAGFRSYEELIDWARDAEPQTHVDPADPWTLMYTSGTTGNPKGVVRSHRSAALLSLVTEIELRISRDDSALLVMPMCHANSLNFFVAFAYVGAANFIYSRKSFDAEHCARVLSDGQASFTSLVPTHYIMMLSLPRAERAGRSFDRVRKLMISSAPARQDTKRGIMEMFPNSGLYELYGSTETGWATMLHPDEQFLKLGSVGRECVGSAPIRLLGENGDEVSDGEAGELYCQNPYLFDGYWKLPEKTAAAFRGDYCSVGDMARRDEDGYIHLVDRKSNMIISGGENIYPSEVEALIGEHPLVKDVAVIGLPDERWGERVHAVVVPHAGVALDAAEVLEWAKARMAGFKRPKTVSLICDEDMPRNATGKILHRELKARHSQ